MSLNFFIRQSSDMSFKVRVQMSLIFLKQGLRYIYMPLSARVQIIINIC